MAHDYTNGTGANQNFVSADGVVTLDLGDGGRTLPFAGGVFSPARLERAVLRSGGADGAGLELLHGERQLDGRRGAR